MSLDDAWRKVKDFHILFKHPTSEKPKMISKERVLKRKNWMEEEIQEFLDANTLEDQTDAMIDLIYFALGTLVEMGVKPTNIFDIVHNANMTKIWKDGNLQYHPDGKTKKPPNWIDPKPLIEKEIRYQNEN